MVSQDGKDTGRTRRCPVSGSFVPIKTLCRFPCWSIIIFKRTTGGDNGMPKQKRSKQNRNDGSRGFVRRDNGCWTIPLHILSGLIENVSKWMCPVLWTIWRPSAHFHRRNSKFEACGRDTTATESEGTGTQTRTGVTRPISRFGRHVLFYRRIHIGRRPPMA